MTTSYRFFRENLCDRCGACFSACPYLELPIAEARKEIEALIAGENSRSRALEVCNTCHTCDVQCPREADPYELVLQRWGEERVAGMPTTSKLVMPNQPCNIWNSLRAIMPKEELALLDSWDDLSPREEICLTGFYTNVVPYIFQAGVLEDLPMIVGSEGFWGCAGDIYKTGRHDMVEQITRRLEKVFSDMCVKKVIGSMSAEAIVLADTLPQRFGADFDFELLPIDLWLLDKIQSGDIDMDRKLDMTVTIHDNCLSKLKGGVLQEANRAIAELTGCRIVEMKHNRERAMCCGFGAAATHFRIIDIMHSGYQRLKEAEDTGADAMVIYCPACMFILSVIKEMAGSDMPFYHPIELVEMATGGEPAHRHEERAWDIIAVISNHLIKYALFPSYRRDFQPDFIPPEMESLPELPRADRARLKVLATLYHSPLVQNRVIRSLNSAGFKALVRAYDMVRRAMLKAKR
ncbi:MAG: (Fe-S)-binding protein [Actinomycetota bacterium]|nr:(Fe-S)-binding protein [Actinomycetota bacterium]